MSEDRNKEYFKDTFSEIQAPSALVGKVLSMTANNDKKARPKATKKLIAIVAAVVVVLAATLTVMSVTYDRGRQITFGNSPWYEDENVYDVDPETGEHWFKPEYWFSHPQEEMIFDLPAIIDKDKIPIPEGYELTFEELRRLEDTPPYHTTWVVYDFSNVKSYEDENGTTMREGKRIWITIEEIYEGMEVSLEHDGEMFQTKVGNVDLYYFNEERIPTNLGFEHDEQITEYLAVGKKYKIHITTIVYDTECEAYDWDDLPTLEEVCAIVEAIDNMIYPK